MAAAKVTRKFVRTLLRKAKPRAKPLKPPPYSSEEIELLLTYVAGLRKDVLQRFLADRDLARSGNKTDVITRLQEAIDEETLFYDDLIELLDNVEPWAKQHVFLYDGTTPGPTKWRDPTWVSTHLKANRVHKYLNERTPLLLPPNLRISTIEHDANHVRVVAVERRVGFDRNEDLDQDAKDPDGEEVELRAYVRRVTRGLIAFEWDLQANEAFLQVTQLPTHARYEDAIIRFTNLVQAWLPFGTFPPVDIRAAIAEFRRLEPLGQGAVRSHSIDVAAPDGRRLGGVSASAQQPLLGNADIDTALQAVFDNGGVGHLGNFYLLPDATDSSNPIKDGEVHVVLLGNRGRINIMTPQTEDVVRYALRRVREAC
jgi:hypothetical protein